MGPPMPSSEGAAPSETTPLMDTNNRRSLDMSLLYMESGSEQIDRKLPVSLPTIGFLGSLSIAVNSITGPAMVNLPLTFQRSGVIPTTLTLVFICILSSLCSLHMANTISKVPGNDNFRKEVEFSQAFYMFWGRKWFIFTQTVYFLCVTCLNISSMVDTAQVVDTFVGHWISNGAVALQLSSTSAQFVRWDPSSCTQEQLVSGECIPFMQHSGLLLTVGYIITIVLFLPLALMDLKVRSLSLLVIVPRLLLPSRLLALSSSGKRCLASGGIHHPIDYKRAVLFRVHSQGTGCTKSDSLGRQLGRSLGCRHV